MNEQHRATKETRQDVRHDMRVLHNVVSHDKRKNQHSRADTHHTHTTTTKTR